MLDTTEKRGHKSKRFAEQTMDIKRISRPTIAPLPQHRAHVMGSLRANSLQSKIVNALLRMEVGEMITITFNGDIGNLRARITNFKKRHPDYNVKTRQLSDDELGVWRIA